MPDSQLLHIGAGVHIEQRHPDAVLRMVQPKMPDWRFEYHPKSKIVYAIPFDAIPAKALVIYNEIESDGMAQICVQCFLRGFLTHKDKHDMSAHVLIE